MKKAELPVGFKSGFTKSVVWCLTTRGATSATNAHQAPILWPAYKLVFTNFWIPVFFNVTWSHLRSQVQYANLFVFKSEDKSACIEFGNISDYKWL